MKERIKKMKERKKEWRRREKKLKALPFKRRKKDNINENFKKDKKKLTKMKVWKRCREEKNVPRKNPNEEKKKEGRRMESKGIIV